MKIFRSTVAALLLIATNAIATPASDSSVKQLLAVMQAQKLVDGMRVQFDSLMNTTIQQALKGKVPSPKQQQAITNLKNRMVAIMQGELAWEKLEPMYLRLYKESFSEEEVGSMLAFYKTPAGQAVIYKMPALTQKTMIEVQKMVIGVSPKMQKVQEQFAAEMASANN